MPLLRRVGLRWIFAVAQCIFCVILLVDLFRANRHLQEPGSLFAATTSSPVVVFQELNLPIVFLVSVPKLWLEERWTSMLDTIQGGVLAVMIVTLFWFGVGRWLDRQFGLYPRATWPGNKYSIFLSGMGLVLFGTIAVRFLWADADLVSRLCAFAWCLFGCWALATHIRRCWPTFRRQFENK
jgi:hypothetical protein